MSAEDRPGGARLRAPGPDTIDVLLATYNGGRFLDAQLQSIAAQTHGDWRLLVRDDGSTDDTLAQVAAFADAHPGRVALIDPGGPNLRATGNFSRLMTVSRAPYVALADQDDLWLPMKLEAALATLRRMEAEHGVEAPLLVFTDRIVVDEDDAVIAPSWSAHEGLPMSIGESLQKSLMLNVVAGCTTLFNRRLCALAAPTPPHARAHDQWLALVATLLGAARRLPQAHIHYRRHGTNFAGMRQVPRSNYLARARMFFTKRDMQRQRYAELFEQARALLALHGTAASPAARARLEAFVALQGMSRFRRQFKAHAGGFLPPGLERRIAFLFI